MPASHVPTHQSPGDLSGQSGRPGTEVAVLVVDDHAPFREVARTVVGLAPGFRCVGEVGTGGDAVAAVRLLGAQLVLMDINLPGINGIEATRRIRSEDGRAVVVLLSTYTESDLPADARTCGATAYVHKEEMSPDLLRRVWDARDTRDTRT
jgi:two-component system invasion response regulator UvrY